MIALIGIGLLLPGHLLGRLWRLLGSYTAEATIARMTRSRIPINRKD